jgi:hypothetical protein
MLKGGEDNHGETWTEETIGRGMNGGPMVRKGYLCIDDGDAQKPYGEPQQVWGQGGLGDCFGDGKADAENQADGDSQAACAPCPLLGEQNMVAEDGAIRMMALERAGLSVLSVFLVALLKMAVSDPARFEHE